MRSPGLARSRNGTATPSVSPLPRTNRQSANRELLLDWWAEEIGNQLVEVEKRMRASPLYSDEVLRLDEEAIRLKHKLMKLFGGD